MNQEDTPSFLSYGYRSADEVADVVLADPLQAGAGKPKKKPKKGPSSRRGQTVVVIAAGFPGYESEQQEITELGGSGWVPHSADFAATAQHDVQTPYRATNVDEFLGAAAAVPGQISRFVFIGHGSPSKLGFSGARDGSVVRFSQFFSADDLADERWLAVIKQHIVPKFVEAATVDLVACNLGIGQEFLQAMANAFERPIRAFTGPVSWTVAMNKGQTGITERGLTSRNPVDEPFRRGFKHLVFTATVAPA
ncbi:MAG TPA: hypothetical protein VJH03_03840 [Blastocatellia bacterium]|nr:hypothetical protein [Blastocatellia bacterium]